MGIELNVKYKPLFTSKARYFAITGGRGSGKSFSIATFAVLLSFEEGQNILFTRYTSTSTDISIKPQIELAIKLLGKEQDFNIQQNLITNLTNGNKIYFKGLKAGSGTQTANNKGFADVSCMIIDEADEIPTFDEFEKAELSIRKKGVQNRIILILNPCSEEHWIYKEFYEDLNGLRDDVERIHTTYLDNLKNLNQSVIDKYERLKTIDYRRYETVVLGGWGKVNTGGEFYPNFNKMIHVREISYNPQLPLFISVDENVVPYNTLLVCQIVTTGNHHTVNVIDEICEFDKNLQGVCSIFLSKYRNHKQGLYVFGDATSQKKDTKLEIGYNYYTLITKYLAEMKPILRLPKANPSVILSKQFMDAILGVEINSIDIVINKHCKETIKDFENTKIGKDGKKDKTIYRDPVRNISYQKYGHTSDALTYLITENFNKEFRDFEYGYSDFKGQIGKKHSNTY